MKIDREKSAIIPEGRQVVQAIVDIVSPYLPNHQIINCEEYIPQNITLKEVSRATGLSLKTVAGAIKSEVVYRSGKTGYTSGVLFTDTVGHDWYIRVGSQGSKRPKQAARVAGKNQYGAKDRIRQSIEGKNKRENTIINFTRWY